MTTTIVGRTVASFREKKDDAFGQRLCQQLYQGEKKPKEHTSVAEKYRKWCTFTISFFPCLRSVALQHFIAGERARKSLSLTRKKSTQTLLNCNTSMCEKSMSLKLIELLLLSHCEKKVSTKKYCIERRRKKL